MNHTYLTYAHRLTDGELTERLAQLAAQERTTTAELVAHLAEFDARRLYRGYGYNSTFAYCREALLLSEHATYNRIEVARAARRFPVVLDLLAQGVVHLTAVKILAPHLTTENHLELLQSARGRTRLQVEELVARLAPRPDVPTTMRKLPEPPAIVVRAETALAMETCLPASDALPASRALPEIGTLPATVQAAVPSPAVPASVHALSADRYRMQVTVTGGMLEKLALAKDLLRHALPSGNETAILERALDALLTELTKKKFAVTDRPRPGRKARPESRDVPAEVKRAVFLRDLGRCAYVGTNGRRCSARGFLEFHHLRPYAHNGPGTVENVQLRCRLHNLYEWEFEHNAVRLEEAEWHRRRDWSSFQDELQRKSATRRQSARRQTRGGGQRSPSTAAICLTSG